MVQPGCPHEHLEPDLASLAQASEQNFSPLRSIFASAHEQPPPCLQQLDSAFFSFSGMGASFETVSLSL